MNNREFIPTFAAILICSGGALLFYYQSAIFLPIVIALITVTAVLKVGLNSLLDYYHSTTFFTGA
jgi:hypothetical protein